MKQMVHQVDNIAHINDVGFCALRLQRSYHFIKSHCGKPLRTNMSSGFYPPPKQPGSLMPNSALLDAFDGGSVEIQSPVTTKSLECTNIFNLFLNLQYKRKSKPVSKDCVKPEYTLIHPLIFRPSPVYHWVQAAAAL